MAVDNKIQMYELPGKDPDPDGKLLGYIKMSWAPVTLCISIGVVGLFYKIIDYDLANTYDFLSIMKIVSVVACFLNTLIWVWFPYDDVKVLCKWIRVKNEFFYTPTIAIFFMVFTAILASLLPIVASLGAIYFGAVGFLLYTINFVSFDFVRKQVMLSSLQTKKIFSDQPTDKRKLLVSSLGHVLKYFSCELNGYRFANFQQIRHGLMVAWFVVVIVVAIYGELVNSRNITAVAYLIGVVNIFSAETILAIRRNYRDSALNKIVKKLNKNG